MRKTLLFLVLIFSGMVGWSQEVSWPEAGNNGEGTIFQRNQQGNALIRFVVSNTSEIPVLQVRYRQYSISTGEAGNYIDPRNGSPDLQKEGWLNNVPFTGTGTCQISFEMTIKGGLYLMETNIDSPARIFGVGEVFAIAGQSNAAGYALSNAKSLGYANQRFVRYFNKKESFDPVDPGGAKAPGSKDFIWYWGKLGEKLVNYLQVPVAFYQAAWSATRIRNWESSSDSTTGIVFPYKNLRNTITAIKDRYGMRAILWHQGEQDNKAVGLYEPDYAAKLNRVISASRRHAGDNLPWVIAQASYIGRTLDPAINIAQKQVIGFYANGYFKEFGDSSAVSSNKFRQIFRGPDTDLIGPEFRRTGDGEPTHFNEIVDSSAANCGQCKAADKWFEALTSSQQFFKNSIPLLNKKVVDIPLKPCIPTCGCKFKIESVIQSTGRNSGQVNFNGCDVTDIQWQLIDRNNVLTTIETTPKSNTFPFLIPPYLLSGTYQIKVNVLNCKGGDVASLAYIQPPPLVLETSLDEVHPFIAFPNPTSGRLEIKFFAKKAQTAAFTLTDMQGKKMISKELVSKEGVNSYEFDIKNIPSGTYLIHLQSDNNQETFKIFKTDQ